MYLVFLSMTYYNVFHFVISNSMTVLLNTIHHKDKTDMAILFLKNCNMIKTTAYLYAYLPQLLVVIN